MAVKRPAWETSWMVRRALFCSAIVLASAHARAEPATLDEYNAEMAQLRARIRAAKIAGDDETAGDLRAEVARLRGFGALHVHKQDPDMVTSGFVVLGVGGAAFIGGAIALLVGAFSNCHPDFIFPICSGDSGVMTGGGVAMGIGATFALVSIPMIVAGRKLVFETTPRLVVGPARVGIELSF